MSWTYSGNPKSNDRDEVRFWVQDTNPESPLLEDQEIEYLLNLWQDGTQFYTIRVAALAAEVLANRYAKQVSVSADGVSVALSELMQRYNDLAASLRDQWHSMMANVGSSDFAGLILDINTYDPSIRPLVFGIGFMDNALVGQQDFGTRAPGAQIDTGL